MKEVRQVSEGVNLFSNIMTAIATLTPIFLGVLAHRLNKKERADKKYQKLREEVEKEREDKARQQEQERVTQMEKLQNDVDGLRKEVKEVSERIDMENLNKTLDKLILMSSINMEFSQSVSQLVVAIGEGINNQSELIDNSRLNAAIQLHKQTERDLTQKMYNSIY